MRFFKSIDIQAYVEYLHRNRVSLRKEGYLPPRKCSKVIGRNPLNLPRFDYAAANSYKAMSKFLAQKKEVTA